MTPNQLMRKDTAKHMRQVHRALLIHTYEDEDKLEKSVSKFKTMVMAIVLIITLFLVFAGCSSVASASTASKAIISEPNIAGHSLNQWCAAIYLAEGGEHTKHPYGILAHYKHTTPLQACRNTVTHQYRQWLKSSKRERFLDYLARHYAPVGASNDPRGLNKNWVNNVEYYLGKGQQ